MPPRLRPTRLEYVVDGVKLRTQLTTAAQDAIGDQAEQRRRALEILKAALFRGRMIAKERLENGAGGIETTRLISGVTDEVITALYDFTTVHVYRARNPSEGERLAVMAVGGYGRGTLAPFSDIDLLFVRPYKQTPHAESVIEYMLYALWDLGFKVGHASRTVEECVRLSREDFTIRTSILEARRGLAVAGVHDGVVEFDAHRRLAEGVGSPSHLTHGPAGWLPRLCKTLRQSMNDVRKACARTRIGLYPRHAAAPSPDPPGICRRRREAAQPALRRGAGQPRQ